MLRISRWTMLGIGLVSLAVAFVAPVDLFWLVYFVGTLYASSWGPVALMSVWSKRITADAAFWGILSGFLFNVGPKALETLGWISLPIWLDPILLGGLVSLLVILLVSRLDRPTDAEQRYREQLHVTPAEDCVPGKLLTTARIPWLMVIYSLGLSK